MIRTVLAGQEYTAAARAAGVYAHLLSYVGRIQGGEQPPLLPGEADVAASRKGFAPAPVQLPRQHEMIEYGVNAIRPVVQQRPAQIVAKGRRNEKAINYFQSCLQVLGLEEEVALTDDALKRAYKRAAVKAHPDKGGSEEEFEAVTRAHAYLGEILRRISGRGGAASSEASTMAYSGGGGGGGGQPALQNGGVQDARPSAVLPPSLNTIEPVRLNPKKLDMKAFNEMFEKTRIPDPDDDGYGDWLKDNTTTNEGPKFSGKFNRDVFNAAFEEEAKRSRGGAGGPGLADVEAMTLAPHAVEIGRGKASSYTAAANASLKFTDLRSAYTDDANITSQVANVQVEDRKFATYSAQWKQGPTPLKDGELAAIKAAEQRDAAREDQRRARADQQRSVEEEYFNRMKGLVITNK